MLGNERFLVTRNAKPNATASVAWFYPNTYAVGMFGLGYQLVWWVLEQDHDMRVFRGFTDKQDVGTEDCDLFGFTLAWELDYANVLTILQKNGVASTSDERRSEDPIVFGGGPVLSANPEPFSNIFDVILLGDAEVTVPKFLAAFKELDRAKPRRAQLIELAKVPGLYVPSLYHVEYEEALGPLKSVSPIVDSAPEFLSKQIFSPPPDYVAHSVMLSPDTAWGDIFLVEVVRSCPQECRFCLASFLTRPFRATNPDTLLKAIDMGLEHTKNIGLLGPSVTEHPQFELIADKLREKEARISVASVRADTLTENILATMKHLGQRSVTIAIESGSERLRTIMKKNLSEAEIEHAVELIDRSGLEAVKFYGIAGLPYESQEDLEETIRLLTQLKKKHKRLRFVFGCSSFVPKAQTPFQWAGRDRTSGAKLEYLRKSLSRIGIEVRPESHNWSDIQAMLSRGDRRLVNLLNCVSDGGAKIGAWKKALRETTQTCPGLDYYAFRTMQPNEFLPWSHLVDANRTEFLAKHSAQAQLSASP